MSELQIKLEDPSKFENEQRPRKRQARERGPAKLTPALYKAEVKIFAETGSARRNLSNTGVDDTILQRIQKCLQRANHPQTPEAEAKAAFHVASQLMSRYNVTQAEVLAHEPPDLQKKYAGQSVVSVKRADGSSKPVKQQNWVQSLVTAMQTFFDCKSYSTGLSSSTEWTFYGIADNTVTAATAFEMAYNLIVEWARPYKGAGTRNSYCIGAAGELQRMAMMEKKDEEDKAKAAEFQAEFEAIKASVEQEDAQRQEKVEQLVSIPSVSDATSPGVAVASNAARFPFPVEQVDEGDSFCYPEPGKDEDEDDIFDHMIPDFKVEADDSNQINPLGDIIEEIMKRVKRESASSERSLDRPSSIPEAHTTGSTVGGGIKQEQGETEENTPIWGSSMQLIKFRATASRIADDFVKDQGIKLSHRTSLHPDILDFAAYKQGARDGQKIDVRRKKIEGQAW